MTYDTLTQRRPALPTETQIADAVLQLGLLKVLTTAVGAWWGRPRLPPDLPERLRADVGLSPMHRRMRWTDVSFTTHDFDRYTR